MATMDVFRDVSYDDLMDVMDPRTLNLNTTVLIEYGGYAIAGFAVAIVAALAIFYILGLGTTRRRTTYEDNYYDDEFYGRSFDAKDQEINLVAVVIAELEKAFQKYGLANDDLDCQQRMLCEAFLTHNTDNKKSLTFRAIFESTVKVDKQGDSEEDVQRFVKWRSATIDGGKGDCSKYVAKCTQKALK